MRTELISIPTPTHPLDGCLLHSRRADQGRGDVLPRQSDEFLRVRRALSRAPYYFARLRLHAVQSARP